MWMFATVVRIERSWPEAIMFVAFIAAFVAVVYLVTRK
jgi:hypothetical protein